MNREDTGPIIIGGATLDFMVEPLYTMYRRDGSRIPNSWLSYASRTPKQRPAFWQVTSSPVEDSWMGTDVSRHRTRKAALEEAERLANENKTHALLTGG